MPSRPGHEDPIQFTPEPHDVRLERGTWIYYVRGVKKWQLFRSDGLSPTDLGGLILALPIAFLWGRRQERAKQWKVGVLRFRKDGGGLIRVIHKETLDPGIPPERRITALARDVTAGRFDQP